MWTRASSAMLWSRSLPTADRVQSCFVVDGACEPAEVRSQAVLAHGHERSMDSLLIWVWVALPDDQNENEPNCWFEDVEMQRQVCE